MLLGQLKELQRIGDIQPQIIRLVHDLQQTALLGLGGDDHAMLGEQALEIVRGDILAGNRALADAGEHGVGQIQAHINLLTSLGIRHS